MFLRIFLICVFLSVSQAIWNRGHHGRYGYGKNHGSHYPRHKTVVMNPPPQMEKLNEEQMDDYIELQQNKLLMLAKKVTNGTADMCRWNYATLTDRQKRACSCLNVFSFLNENPGDLFDMAYKIYVQIWEKLSHPGGPIAACSERDTGSPRTLHHVCVCFTGQSLV